MEAWLERVASGGIFGKAALLAAAGMAGVFITLLLFYLLIAVLERFSKK